MTFSVIHASRGRPEKALEIINHTFATAKNKDFEYILTVDPDDEEVDGYADIPDMPGLCILVVDLPEAGFVTKNNFAAKRSVGDIIVLVEDDYYLPSEWDDRILEVVERDVGDGWRQKEWVVWAEDNDKRWWNKQRYPEGYISKPIISRPYYLRKGDLFWPEYKHYYCDPDFYSQALKDHVKIINAKKEIVCVHAHYQNPKGNKKDATYERAEAWMARDREIFKLRWGI